MKTIWFISFIFPFSPIHEISDFISLFFREENVEYTSNIDKTCCSELRIFRNKVVSSADMHNFISRCFIVTPGSHVSSTV